MVLLQREPLERKPGSGAKEEATRPHVCGTCLAQPLLDWALL